MGGFKKFLPILCAGIAAALPANVPHDARLRARDGTFTTIPATTSYEPTVVATQSARSTAEPESGIVNTSLEPDAGSGYPFPTSAIENTGSLQILDQTLEPDVPEPTAAQAPDIFVPIASGAPPSQIGSRGDHPASAVGINDMSRPIGTNKFYANLFLGSQTQGVWTLPYSVSWSKGGGESKSWGMGITHIEPSQFAFGQGNPAPYFVAPIGIDSIILSATELGTDTKLTSDSHTAFFANADLRPRAGASPAISFPLVQGSGFVTSIYRSSTPLLQSGVFFSSLTFVKQISGSSPIYKYRIVLNDQKVWLMYVVPTGSTGQPPFRLENSGRITGPSGFNGLIQIAKNNDGDKGEAAHDAAAGAYASGATLTGSVDGTTGSYTIAWSKGGLTEKTLLMYALPHHVAAFDSATQSANTGVRLQTPTKGVATAIAANRMTMIEAGLPTTFRFAPWDESTSRAVSQSAMNAINSAAGSELGQDMQQQCVLNSMYYSGKCLAKFAQIIYAANDIGKNSQIAASGLVKLKSVFDTFVQNRQPFPLVYDSRWKGLVSTASYGGDVGADFGNTLYNDHHFHYGYFVYAAAVIGYLDPSWLNQGSNKAWVNSLLRDFANPSASDQTYAHHRAFDWYNGHSWAKGLFESADGKDQESTSEDTFASYGMKMWGRIIGDPNMEARGNLQLGVQKRSFNAYFLMASDNKNQPANFIGNKVTGILFENKIDHTTYFGNNIEYIQGIHMIPISPISAYYRPQTFVREEWNTYFSNGRVDQIQGGWRGILYSNLALIDPRTAYNFFASSSFNNGWLDGGASRAWYLALTAGLGGSLA